MPAVGARVVADFHHYRFVFWASYHVNVFACDPAGHSDLAVVPVAQLQTA